GEHVLVCTDNTATVAHIDHQDGVRSFRRSQLTRHLLLWSQHRLKLLCATHILGDRFALRRVEASPSDSLAVLESIRPGTGSLIAQTQCNVGNEQNRFSWYPCSVQRNLVLGARAPTIVSFLTHPSEKEPPSSGEGHNLALVPRSLELPSMVPGCDQEVPRNLPPTV
ncbi:hypothetical protein M9458_055698, partial [Cirrhinus mrigala]